MLLAVRIADTGRADVDSLDNSVDIMHPKNYRYAIIIICKS